MCGGDDRAGVVHVALLRAACAPEYAHLSRLSGSAAECQSQYWAERDEAGRGGVESWVDKVTCP